MDLPQLGRSKSTPHLKHLCWEYGANTTGVLDGFCCKKRKILGQMWNQRERKRAITKGPMSVQHTSAMFITKKWTHYKNDQHQQLAVAATHGTCHDQLGWNWNANQLLGSNQIIGFLLSHRLMFQVPSPRPQPCAHAGTPRPHPVFRTHRWMFHQWFMYKGTTNIALQGRTNGFHTYLSCDSNLSVCTVQHRW